MLEQAIEVLKPGRPVWVTIDASVSHRCPLDGTVNNDHVEIVYHAGQGVIEAIAYESYLDLYDPMAITVEDLVVSIRDDLLAVGIADPQVRAWGEHADRLMIEVRTYRPAPL